MNVENQVALQNNFSSDKTLRDHVLITINDFFETIKKDGDLGLHTAVLDEVESAIYESVMKFTKGNQSQAGKILSVARNTLRTKLLKYFGTTRVGGLYHKYEIQPLRAIQHSIKNKGI